ncbi:unnamed protein product, partial [Brenthis ino]
MIIYFTCAMERRCLFALADGSEVTGWSIRLARRTVIVRVDNSSYVSDDALYTLIHERSLTDVSKGSSHFLGYRVEVPGQQRVLGGWQEFAGQGGSFPGRGPLRAAPPPLKIP